jgi:hypothetical protein
MIARVTTSGAITEFPLPSGLDLYPPVGPVAGGDGNLWFTMGPGRDNIGRLSVAEPGVRYVLSREAGFVPASVSVQPGKTVQWTFYGPAVHEVRDSTGLGLFDSGPQSIVSFFRTTFTASGVYAYSDPLDPGQTGKVTVGVGASPTSGSVATAFTLTWASAPPTGARVFDVQILRPGATKYVNWMPATTATSATFTPDSGPGNYVFRARLRDTATGAKSGYAGKTITVK